LSQLKQKAGTIKKNDPLSQKLNPIGERKQMDRKERSTAIPIKRQKEMKISTRRSLRIPT